MANANILLQDARSPTAHKTVLRGWAIIAYSSEKDINYVGNNRWMSSPEVTFGPNM